MPKKAMDYTKTIIYKIVCKDLNISNCYVGHTTNFIKRKSMHKYCCNNNSYSYFVYETIRNNGGWDNWSMLEIEKYSCNDFNEATKRERYWIETLKADLNKSVPSRTRQERQKNYYEQNKCKIKDKFKNYQKEYREKNKENQKKYYEQNKDKLKEYQKKYIEQKKLNNNLAKDLEIKIFA
jgi:hypothetical protein